MPPRKRGATAAAAAAAAAPPKEKPPPRQSALAKEHSISAATEAEIKEAFTLFASPSTTTPKNNNNNNNNNKKPPATLLLLPSASLRRALTALGVPPSSPSELHHLLEAADPDASASIPYPYFVAVAALKLNTRGDESAAREVEDAFSLFVRLGNGEEEGEEARITIETLRRVAKLLKEDVADEVLRDMLLEANAGVGGVGVREFEAVMRRAGVF